MIILEDNNRIIQSSLSKLCSGNDKDELLDMKFCDFGETKYHLWTSGNDTETLNLSMTMPSSKELFKLGLTEHIQQKFPNCKVIQTDNEKHGLSLSFPRSSLNEKSITDLALLRRTCLGLPLELAIQAQESGKQSNIMSIPLRDNDIMYVQGFADRVIVVLSTTFDDPSDVVLGKVFIQEFFDVRRLNNLQNAPAVLYGKEPPKEFSSHIPAGNGQNFITLILFPCHYSVATSKREKCISMVLSFRDYFHYHLKCCKSYLHDRMRAKVSEFLKMLNRTKPVASLRD